MPFFIAKLPKSAARSELPARLEEKRAAAATIQVDPRRASISAADAPSLAAMNSQDNQKGGNLGVTHGEIVDFVLAPRKQSPFIQASYKLAVLSSR